jgi:hypothetical protein
VCAVAQDFEEQDFPERNLLQRASRTPQELLRCSEAALVWFSFLSEHLKINEKMLSSALVWF